MRDYVEIIHQLRQFGHTEAADAMEELHGLARRMTALGADLEDQIREENTPDFYAILDSDNPLTLMVRPEILREMALPYQLPAKWTALKIVGDSWFVRFNENEELQEFFDRADLEAAIQRHEEK